MVLLLTLRALAQWGLQTYGQKEFSSLAVEKTAPEELGALVFLILRQSQKNERITVPAQSSGELLRCCQLKPGVRSK